MIPGTYHLYFGDDAGSPGTILTFFPWPRASRGHAGAGEVAQTAFSVPLGSIQLLGKADSVNRESWSRTPANASTKRC